MKYLKEDYVPQFVWSGVQYPLCILTRWPKSKRSEVVPAVSWENEAIDPLFPFHGPWGLNQVDMIQKFTLHRLRVQWKSLEPTLDYEYWMLVEQFSMGSTSDCLELFSFKSTRLDLVSTRLSSSLNFDSISLLAVTAFFVRYQYQCEFNFLLRNHRPK